MVVFKLKFMNYIPLKDIPENRLPIYFCNATLKILEVKRNKRTTYYKDLKKIVLKGVNEDDLKKNILKKESKFLSKMELKYSKIVNSEIEIIKFLSFGIFE